MEEGDSIVQSRVDLSNLPCPYLQSYGQSKVWCILSLSFTRSEWHGGVCCFLLGRVQVYKEGNKAGLGQNMNRFVGLKGYAFFYQEGSMFIVDPVRETRV